MTRLRIISMILLSLSVGEELCYAVSLGSLVFPHGCVVKDVRILIFFKRMKLRFIAGSVKESQSSYMTVSIQ